MPAHPRRPVGRRSSVEGRRTFWGLAGLTLLVVGLGLGRAATRVAVMERSREVGTARDAGQRLQRELKAVELQLATLAGAGRVQEAAEERLGMRRVAAERIGGTAAETLSAGHSPAHGGEALAIELR